MLAMKGGKRPPSADGKVQQVPLEVIGPVGIKAMVDSVYSFSQTIINYPIIFTELEEGKAVDLGKKEGGWSISAFPLSHR